MRLTLAAGVSSTAALAQRQQHGAVFSVRFSGAGSARRNPFSIHHPLRGGPAATNACRDHCGTAAEPGGGVLLACRSSVSPSAASLGGSG